MRPICVFRSCLCDADSRIMNDSHHVAARSCLFPQREAHAAAGAGGRAIARDVFLPDVLQVPGGAGHRDPVADFRIAGIELLHRDRRQRLAVIALERVEHAAVEFLVDGEMAQAAGGEDADARARPWRSAPPCGSPGRARSSGAGRGWLGGK